MNPFLNALQQQPGMEQMQQPFQPQGMPQFMGGMPQAPQMQQPALDPYGQKNTGLKQALMRGIYGRY